MTEAIDPHTCFDLDGTRVHGDPGMSDEARAAIREVIAAVQRRMGCQHCGRPPETDGNHIGLTDRGTAEWFRIEELRRPHDWPTPF